MLVRIVIGSALCLALAACATLSVPGDLPAIALGQPSIYRLEVALSVFYACLLIVTPTYSGLIAGRLPIEISTRGARFAEEADQTAKRDEKTIKELELGITYLKDGLANARVEIKRLGDEREVTERDRK